MLRTVHLHGRLGKRFGRRFELDVNSPIEAIRALTFQLPGFAAYIRPRGYQITVGEGTVIDREALPLRLGQTRDIHITPAGMVSGLETILLGITLLFTAYSVVQTLLMPKVNAASSREDDTKTASFIFDGAQNVTEQGHPVPLVYGRFRTGSVVVSAGISTADVNADSLSTDPTNPTLGPGSPVYGGYVGSTAGIKGSVSGDEWLNLSKGGKSGSSSARAAQEDPDSLQSAATAKILEAISEGEIGGLVDGLKSIYFDDTPVQNADGSFNFAGVAVEQRVGLPDQDFIPGFTQTEQTREISTAVKVSTGPITRTIDDPDATVARVTIRLPQLYQQDTTNGDLKETTVEIKIAVQADQGGFTDVVDKVFTGKTNSGYQWSTDIRLPAGTERDIRVTRVTPDSTLASLSNATEFDLLTEIVEAKLSYPDTALIGLTVDARQFGSSIPARSYEVFGIKVEVPSNYDPVARTYTGIWDGTFVRAGTDNAAWIYRDLIVARRYGLGQRVDPNTIDKWALYAIAQYNDGMVPDGFGGMQPRYTLNVVITDPAGAYDVLASVTSNFRALSYWGSGAVVAVQDRPEDPSILLAPANVVDGVFSYGRITPAEKRRSVAIVYWNDPTDSYKLTPEIYEDPVLIRRFGRRGDSQDDAVNAFGVTNRGQAHRMARWIMEDEAPGSNATAKYSVGDDHGFVEPGRVAELADPMFTMGRRGGRVVAADANTMTIDAPYNFDGASNYSLRVMLPDGTVTLRPVTNAAGEAAILTLGGNEWPVFPNPGAVWTIETDTVANRQWRVRSISTDDAPYEVNAVAYDPTKWARVEFARDISTPNFFDLPSGPLQAPVSIKVFEFLLTDGNASIPCVQVSWSTTDPRVTFYQAQYQPPGGNWTAFADGLDTSREVRNAVPGDYQFRVRSLDSLGNKTAWSLSTYELDGQVDAIPNVVGLMTSKDDVAIQTMIVWVNPVDTRPLVYRVLFSAAGVFADSILLASINTQEYIVSKAGTYWVQTGFLGAVSVAPPSVVVDASDLPTVDYGSVSGTKPPADATNGAPDGSMVAGRPAEDLVSDLDINASAIIAQGLRQDDAQTILDARTFASGQPVSAVLENFQNTQLTVNTAVQTNFDLLGAKTADGTGWVLNGGSVQIGGGKTLVESLNDLGATNGTLTANVTTLQRAVLNNDGSAIAEYSLSVNVNGKITGYKVSSDGTTDSFSILASRFSVVDDSSGSEITPFLITEGVVYAPSLVVSNLTVNTAVIPIRYAATAPISGSYNGSADWTAIVPVEVFNVVIMMTLPGWIELNITTKQDFNNAENPHPWHFQIYANNVLIPETDVGGNAVEDVVPLQGAYYAAAAGSYTLSYRWIAHSSITLKARSMFAKGFPNTQ